MKRLAKRLTAFLRAKRACFGPTLLHVYASRYRLIQQRQRWYPRRTNPETGRMEYVHRQEAARQMGRPSRRVKSSTTKMATGTTATPRTCWSCPRRPHT